MHSCYCFLFFLFFWENISINLPFRVSGSAGALMKIPFNMIQPLWLRLEANSAAGRKHKLRDRSPWLSCRTRKVRAFLAKRKWRREGKERKNHLSLRRKWSAARKLAAPRLPFAAITVIISCITVAGTNVSVISHWDKCCPRWSKIKLINSTTYGATNFSIWKILTGMNKGFCGIEVYSCHCMNIWTGITSAMVWLDYLCQSR